MSDWDNSLKTFAYENAQDFVSWLFNGAVFLIKLLTEFESRKLRADVLFEALYNDVRFLLHIEFQSTYDPEMAERLLIYNFEARRAHKLPVVSCVIYLRDVGT